MIVLGGGKTGAGATPANGRAGPENGCARSRSTDYASISCALKHAGEARYHPPDRRAPLPACATSSNRSPSPRAPQIGHAARRVRKAAVRATGTLDLTGRVEGECEEHGECFWRWSVADRGRAVAGGPGASGRRRRADQEGAGDSRQGDHARYPRRHQPVRASPPNATTRSGSTHRSTCRR